MLIGRYLQWVETAPVCARIDAARTLVEAYESADAGHTGRADCELALCALLDDPAATVRRALSEAVAFSTAVPRHLVVALAQDHAAVAAPVLQFSPLLGDADLVDAAAIGDSRAQVAIARRAVVPAPLAAALAEVGGLDAAIALCDNPNAALMPATMRRLVVRFGDDGSLREALLGRDDLDAVVRHDLVEATARALTAFVTDCHWLSGERAERVGRESCERATVTIALQARDEGQEASRDLATHLRARGVLTPALLLRSILSGNAPLFEAALADLTKLPPERIAGQLRDTAGLGFASLYARAKLPALLLPLFRSALAAARQDAPDASSGALRRPVISRVLQACNAQADGSLAKASALLRRFEAEALRDEARAVTTAAWAEDDGEAMPALMPWIIGSIQTAPRLTFQAA